MDEFKIIKRLSIFTWIIVDLHDLKFKWTGVWFKIVVIKNQRLKIRYKGFDSGLTYTEYWKPWKYYW